MTIVPFQPSLLAPFQFQPTLDGLLYTAIITWNVAGQRYYISVYTLQGELVLSLAMVGSPVDYDISLTAGYFASTLVFREQSQQFEITP